MKISLTAFYPSQSCVLPYGLIMDNTRATDAEDTVAQIRHGSDSTTTHKLPTTATTESTAAAAAATGSIVWYLFEGRRGRVQWDKVGHPRLQELREPHPQRQSVKVRLPACRGPTRVL